MNAVVGLWVVGGYGSLIWEFALFCSQLVLGLRAGSSPVQPIVKACQASNTDVVDHGQQRELGTRLTFFDR